MEEGFGSEALVDGLAQTRRETGNKIDQLLDRELGSWL